MSQEHDNKLHQYFATLLPLVETLTDYVDLGLEPDDLPAARDVGDKVTALLVKGKELVASGEVLAAEAAISWTPDSSLEIKGTIEGVKEGTSKTGRKWAMTKVRATAYKLDGVDVEWRKLERPRLVQVWKNINPTTDKRIEDIEVTFRGTVKKLVPKGTYRSKEDAWEIQLKK